MADNNIVLVTGTSTGFGRLISITLARRGYTVFASMRDSSNRNRGRVTDLEALARKEDLRLHVIDMDVTDDGSVQRAVDGVIHDAGTIDVVVNNAGTAYWGLTETFTIDQAQAIFDTNFFGPFRVSRAVLPHMRKRRSGLIVHLSSVAGRLVLPSMGIYCATKFALEAMAETLRYELSQLDIDSIVIEPGPYPTAIFGNAVDPADLVRAADYGPLAEVPRKVLDALAGAEANSQDVADRVVQLIEMPAGTRPLRTIVGMEQFQPVNDITLQCQTALMHSFGFKELMKLRRAERQVA